MFSGWRKNPLRRRTKEGSRRKSEQFWAVDRTSAKWNCDMPPSYVVASSSFESSWRGCGQSPRRGQACARPREGGVGIVREMLTGRGGCRHREGDVDMARGSLTPRGGYNARSCRQRASMRYRQLNGCGRHRHTAVSLRRLRGNRARCGPANRAMRHGTPRQPHGEGLRLRQLDGERLRPRQPHGAARRPSQSHGEARWSRDHGDWGGAALPRRTATAPRRTGPAVSALRSRGTGSSRGLSQWPRGTVPSCPPACTPAPGSATCPCPTGGRAALRLGRSRSSSG